LNLLQSSFCLGSFIAVPGQVHGKYIIRMFFELYCRLFHVGIILSIYKVVTYITICFYSISSIKGGTNIPLWVGPQSLFCTNKMHHF
jgi:hypothetical protein